MNDATPGQVKHGANTVKVPASNERAALFLGFGPPRLAPTPRWPQIVKLVQEAQNSTAPGQQLADRAAFWLVFVALMGGAATLLTWLLAGQSLATAMLFAITVVVITCPDALGLATPPRSWWNPAWAPNGGILFKNALALETSAQVQAVVMDAPAPTFSACASSTPTDNKERCPSAGRTRLRIH